MKEVNTLLRAHPGIAFLLALIASACMMLALNFLLRLLPFQQRLFDGVLMLFGILFSVESLRLAMHAGTRKEDISGMLQCTACGMALASAVLLKLFLPPKQLWLFECARSLSSGLLFFFSCLFLAVPLGNRFYRGNRESPPGNTLIVLGCAVKDNRISKELRRRLDRTAELYAQSNGTLTLLVCGGDTFHTGTPEAFLMKAYLLSLRIPESRILLEDKSLTTVQNFKNASELLPSQEQDAAYFLTSDYHVLRSALCAKEAGLLIPGIGCRTPFFRLIPCLTRESIAWLNRYKLLFAVYLLFLVVICLCK